MQAFQEGRHGVSGSWPRLASRPGTMAGPGATIGEHLGVTDEPDPPLHRGKGGGQGSWVTAPSGGDR